MTICLPLQVFLALKMCLYCHCLKLHKGLFDSIIELHSMIYGIKAIIK